MSNDTEYEAIITIDDEFAASTCGADLKKVIAEANGYMLSYAEDGEVKMQVYRKQLILTEGPIQQMPTRNKDD